jgi:hypothetical protein
MVPSGVLLASLGPVEVQQANVRQIVSYALGRCDAAHSSIILAWLTVYRTHSARADSAGLRLRPAHSLNVPPPIYLLFSHSW